MRQFEAELADREINVVVVSFDGGPIAKAYLEETNLPWPLLIDADFATYQQYGIARGSAWSIYGPSSIWKYLRLIFGKGRRIAKPGSDYRQLGGDILIDPNGVIRFQHASSSPHDRPDVQELLDAVDGSTSPSSEQGDR